MNSFSRKSHILAKILGRRRIERSSNQRRASNTARYERLIGSWMLDVGCWMLGVGYFAVAQFRLGEAGDIAPSLLLVEPVAKVLVCIFVANFVEALVEKCPIRQRLRQ